MGFWTPEYLEAKLETLRFFSGRRILLAVCEKYADEKDLENASHPVFTYKTVIKINTVMEMLEKERKRQ